MSLPDHHKTSDFDLTIGRELQSWAGRQHAPAEVRRRVLVEAAGDGRARQKYSRVPIAAPFRVVRWFRRWLCDAPVRQLPELPHKELSKWLFNQAMWHSLGNDRRAVRFVC
ncbi:MAG TPA: hypothetical protein VMN57_11445 [Anaerolineales bacterium]|nr:hypothetical protein [Anaerolineales bacterium]